MLQRHPVDSAFRNPSALPIGPGLRSEFSPNRPTFDMLGQALTGNFTITRGSSASFFNASGTRVTAATNEPRFDHNPATLSRRGLLIEPLRQNLLLNSTAPATQTTGSLSTGTYILWVEGTGSASVAAATAVITGAGSANASTPLVFNVTTTGTVTVTVTGTLTSFQLEAGTYPTSFIQTSGSVINRSADLVRSTDISALGLVQGRGCILIEFEVMATNPGATSLIFDLSDGTFNNRIFASRSSVGNLQFGVATAGADQGVTNITAPFAAGQIHRAAFAWDTNNVQCAYNSVLGPLDSTVTIPASLTQLNIGSANNSTAFGGMWVRSITTFNFRPPSTELRLMVS